MQPNDFNPLESARPDKEEKLLILGRLVEASNYANDCGRNHSDFAVGLSFFNYKGVSQTALQWLVCQRLIEHRYETTVQGGDKRIFCEAPDTKLTDKSCFAISNSGREIFERLKQEALGEISDQDSEKSEPHAEGNNILPTWCPVTRVLKIAGMVVKHFKWPAPNQEMLINAFAELGWPERVDDPLPPNGVSPKRRLHDTIKCLNRNQINSLIKFRGDGTAQGARWEYRPETTDQE